MSAVYHNAIASITRPGTSLTASLLTADPAVFTERASNEQHLASLDDTFFVAKLSGQTKYQTEVRTIRCEELF